MEFNEALSSKHHIKTFTRTVYKIGCKYETCKGALYLAVLFYLFLLVFIFLAKWDLIVQVRFLKKQEY